MDAKSTQEIATATGVSIFTASAWAKRNGVKKIINAKNAVAYSWTKEDVERFKKRRKRGWEKGRPRNA